MYKPSSPTLAAALAMMVQALPPRPAVRTLVTRTQKFHTYVLEGRQVSSDGAVGQTHDSQRENFEEKGGDDQLMSSMVDI
jgi:hypothetical protein